MGRKKWRVEKMGTRRNAEGVFMGANLGQQPPCAIDQSVTIPPDYPWPTTLTDLL
jgi:hypothetical protein